jgi:ribitol 2-dehydrogenase
LASTEAMLAAGSRVVMVDRDEAALKALCNKHGDAVIPLVIAVLNKSSGDPKDGPASGHRVSGAQRP